MKQQLRDITAIIPFCSYDEPYYKKCIDNLLKTGINCIIVTYTHLYRGEKENNEILQRCKKIYTGNNKVSFTQLQWHKNTSIYLEASSRDFGIYHALYVFPKTEYFIFIDIDEIVDPVLMNKWLDTNQYKKYIGIKLRCYCYDMLPTNRIKGKHYNTVMCRCKYALSLIGIQKARLKYFNNSNKLSRWLAKLSLNPYFYIYSKEPFIHHYTGVRTKENMLKKVFNWSHNLDRDDWDKIIEAKYVQNYKPTNIEVVENKFSVCI